MMDESQGYESRFKWLYNVLKWPPIYIIIDGFHLSLQVPFPNLHLSSFALKVGLDEI